jgi:hypothetical protein
VDRNRQRREEVAVDDKSNRGGMERKLISLRQDYEVRYWTQVLGVSHAELREAVRNAGRSVSAVRAYLQRSR